MRGVVSAVIVRYELSPAELAKVIRTRLDIYEMLHSREERVVGVALDENTLTLTIVADPRGAGVLPVTAADRALAYTLREAQ